MTRTTSLLRVPRIQRSTAFIGTVLVLLVTFASRTSLAQSVGDAIGQARADYSAGRFAQARQELASARQRHPEMQALRRWEARLEEEIRSGHPAPTLELVAARALGAGLPADVERSIALAREHYSRADYREAGSILYQARRNYPDVEVLQRWIERLEDEARAPTPSAELSLDSSGPTAPIRRIDSGSHAPHGGPDYSGFYWTGAGLIAVGGILAASAYFVAAPLCTLTPCADGDPDSAVALAGLAGGVAGLGLAAILLGLVLDAGRRGGTHVAAGPGDLGLRLVVGF